MFRVLEFGPNGRIEVFQGPEHVRPPPEGTLRWIDLAAQDEPQLELLRQRFDFHPLALEDCAHLDQRPKLEEYRECLFLVTQGFACNGERVRELAMHELHTFLGKRFLVTVHLDSIAALDKIWNRAAGGDTAALERGAAFLYYLIADGIVDATFPILDKVADEISCT